jgi:DNA-directed RNA polymerase specialized sigma24 family protein
LEVIKQLDDNSYASETDEDLLILISMKDDINSCHSAYDEFYNRYKKFLYGMIQEVCQNFPNKQDLISVIYNNVLISVFKYSDTFDKEGEMDPKVVRKKIESWLARIAYNAFKAALSKTKSWRQDEPGREAFLKMIKSSRSRPCPITYNEKIVGQALAQLKERDRDILRTYYMYYEEGEGGQAKNLPDHILEELKNTYNTTSENIRTIISRSKKIITEFLKKNHKDHQINN